MAEYRNAIAIPRGPSSVPTAASSFTSPAPVLPTICPGNISSSPAPKPSMAPSAPTPSMRAAAIVIPIAATPNVSQFGTRRVFRSTIAATVVLPATAVRTMGSDSTRERLPEHRVHDLAHFADRKERGHRDEAGQEPILDEILALCGDGEHADSQQETAHSALALFPHHLLGALGRRDRRREPRVNRVEDVVDRRVGQAQRNDRDERDESDEQRILDEVLRFLVTNERSHLVEQFRHDASPFARPCFCARYPCPICGHSLECDRANAGDWRNLRASRLVWSAREPLGAHACRRLAAFWPPDNRAVAWRKLNWKGRGIRNGVRAFRGRRCVPKRHTGGEANDSSSTEIGRGPSTLFARCAVPHAPSA